MYIGIMANSRVEFLKINRKVKMGSKQIKCNKFRHIYLRFIVQSFYITGNFKGTV